MLWGWGTGEAIIQWKCWQSWHFWGFFQCFFLGFRIIEFKFNIQKTIKVMPICGVKPTIFFCSSIDSLHLRPKIAWLFVYDAISVDRSSVVVTLGYIYKGFAVVFLQLTLCTNSSAFWLSQLFPIPAHVFNKKYDKCMISAKAAQQCSTLALSIHKNLQKHPCLPKWLHEQMSCDLWCHTQKENMWSDDEQHHEIKHKHFELSCLQL